MFDVNKGRKKQVRVNFQTELSLKLSEIMYSISWEWIELAYWADPKAWHAGFVPESGGE